MSKNSLAATIAGLGCCLSSKIIFGAGNVVDIAQDSQHAVLEEIFCGRLVAVEAGGLGNKFVVLAEGHSPEKSRVNIFQRTPQPHIKKFRQVGVTDFVVIRRVGRHHDAAQFRRLKRTVTIDFADDAAGQFADALDNPSQQAVKALARI